MNIYLLVVQLPSLGLLFLRDHHVIIMTIIILIITDKSICVPVSESGAPATLSWRSPLSSSSSSSRRSGTCSAGSRNETFASHNMSLSLPPPQLYTKLSDIVYLAEPSDMKEFHKETSSSVRLRSSFSARSIRFLLIFLEAYCDGCLVSPHDFEISILVHKSKGFIS